ncbi:hypothetical protein [Thermincola ferriacetica]
MTDLKNKFKLYCNWYKKLEHNKQLSVLDLLNRKEPDLSDFTPEELNELSSMFKLLPKLIAEIGDESKIISFFYKCGLDDLISKSLYDFGLRNSKPYIAAKIIKKLKNDTLSLIVNFVIEKMVLYEDYSETPFNDFLKTTGLKKAADLRAIITFVRYFIDLAASRKNSPIVLNKLLRMEYGLNEEHANIITEEINRNLTELHQAYMMEKINEIASKLSNLSCASDIVDDKEPHIT